LRIEWNQSLSVGFQEIDDQHKELFSRVNKLLDAMSRGKGKDETARLIQFLGDYVVSHFGLEEKYMARYSYPAAATHQLQHSNFLKDFTGLKEKFEKDASHLDAELQIQRRVCDWVVDHVGKSDKLLGPYLASRRT
jgi:hemerythrin